jgi:hypothetical protein
MLCHENNKACKWLTYRLLLCFTAPQAGFPKELLRSLRDKLLAHFALKGKTPALLPGPVSLRSPF